MGVARSEFLLRLCHASFVVESLCADFRRWRAGACAGLDAFSSELLLREALTNSVVHGSADHPRMIISCVLRAKRGRVIMAIQDGGPGFDWRAGWDRRAAAGDIHGRGMEIFRRYASAVRFNPSGNSVTLIQRF